MALSTHIVDNKFSWVVAKNDCKHEWMILKGTKFGQMADFEYPDGNRYHVAYSVHLTTITAHDVFRCYIKKGIDNHIEASRAPQILALDPRTLKN